LVPTAAGQNLFGIVQPFIAELDTHLKTLEKAKDQPFGELRIGSPYEFGKAYFPKIVGSFREQYPDVTFYLKFGDPDTLLPMIANGQIDFALVDRYLTKHPFIGNLDIYHFNPVVEEEIILACSRRYYEEAVKKDHSLENLIRQNFIIYRHNAQTVKYWLKHHFRQSNPHLHVVLTVDSHQAVISAIKNHVGMGIVSSHMIREDIQNGQIIGINTSKSEIINQISMVQLQDKIPTLSEKIFEKFLIKKIQSLGI